MKVFTAIVWSAAAAAALTASSCADSSFFTQCGASSGALCSTGTELRGNECVATGTPSGSWVCGAGTVKTAAGCELPDLGAQLGPFLNAKSNAERASAYQTTTDVDLRLVATQLAQADADAWAGGATSMVGTGLALHFSTKNVPISPSYGSTAPDTATVPLVSGVGTNGNCLDSPTPDLDGRVYVVAWQGGEPTYVGCAKAGYAKVSVTSAGVYNVTISAALANGATFDYAFRPFTR